MTLDLPRRLRAVVLEDSAADAALVIDQLKQAGFEPDWVHAENEAEFVAALDADLDVVLADFNLPSYGALAALDLLKARGLDIPLIVVSGSIGEETAVQVLHAGAADYLLKDRLARLGPAVYRVVTERRPREDKRRAEAALKDAEERARFAMEAARVGTWEVDHTTGIARWSETLEALHGLAPGAFGGTYQAFLEIIHPEDRAAVQAAIDEANRRRVDSHILYRTLWPDGSLHWITGTGKTFYDDAGAPVRAAGVGLDVTEQHNLEEQYRQSQKVEAIGQLAGGIAHDFNNLLTAIQGYSELLSGALPPDSPLQRDVSEIRLAAERAASLTRQLLAFSRRQILQPRILDLRDSVRSMELMIRRLIGEHIDVVLRLAGEPTYVLADPGQIGQVILNLAINARDAMPDGGSLLAEVTTATLDESYARGHTSAVPGSYVMLSVSDTGIGMDAATRARIFEPFFTTKKGEGGTGLGLSTVYGIVKQSGGNIWVYSEPGLGATFKVYLPRVEDAPEEAPTPEPPRVLMGTETLLVVEDEFGLRELVRRSLEPHGYRVLLAATPQEALAIAREHPDPIHLLISDVVLPEMAGPALARQILAARPDTRVMYMSGYTDQAVLARNVLEPGEPFLQKPFTPLGLAQKVREVLG